MKRKPALHKGYKKIEVCNLSFLTFILYNCNKTEIMAKEKSPSKNSAKKEPTLNLKEKRAAKAAKKKTRS